MPAPTRIQSRQNPRVKAMRELADPAARRARASFLVEGPKAVAAALDAGFALEEAWWTGAFAARPDAAALLARLAALPGLAAFEAAPPVFEAISATRTPPGLLAVAREPRPDLDALLGAGGDLVLLADLQDPGNVGTIWRSAAAAGFAAVLQGQGGADPYGPKVIRAAAGAAFLIPALALPVGPDLVARLARAGYAIAAADARGERTWGEQGLAGGRMAVLVGTEGQGLPPALAAAATCRVRIPMAPGVESLNAAICASLLCFERARTRALVADAIQGGTIPRRTEGKRP